MLDLLIQNLNLILKRLIQRWLFFGTQHTHNNYLKIYMKRRQFLSLTTSASLFALSMRGANLFAGEATTAKPFKMLFAPRVGMPTFQEMAGKDEIKRMEFFKGQGFRGVEGVVFIQHKKPFSDKQKQRQKLIGEKAKELGLAMGPQSSMNEKDVPTMTANKTLDGKSGTTAIRDMLKRQLETTFGVLENVGGKTFIIGPGALDKELEWDRQYANVVENMAFCADIVGKALVHRIGGRRRAGHVGAFGVFQVDVVPGLPVPALDENPDGIVVFGLGGLPAVVPGNVELDLDGVLGGVLLVELRGADNPHVVGLQGRGEEHPGNEQQQKGSQKGNTVQRKDSFFHSGIVLKTDFSAFPGLRAGAVFPLAGLATLAEFTQALAGRAPAQLFP